MSMHNFFDIKRLFRLMANDIKSHVKIISIIIATFFILFLLMPAYTTNSIGLYFSVLYISGFIITSLVFKDYHEPLRANLALMLPCSNFERFFNKWLLTSIGFAMGLLVIYYIFSLARAMFMLLFSHQHIPALNLFQTDLWTGIGQYILVQSVFLLGAISFKRYSLVKTLLWISCFFLSLTALSALFTWGFCPTCVEDGYSFHFSTSNLGITFWLLVAPFCWVITYLKLSEIELR